MLDCLHSFSLKNMKQQQQSPKHSRMLWSKSVSCSMMAYPWFGPMYIWPACMHAKSLQSSPILWTYVLWPCQASLSTGFFRQEYWTGLLCPPPRDLPNPEIEAEFLMSPALADGFFTISTTWEAHIWPYLALNTPVLLPGKYHGWRSLVGCSPWGH